MKTLEQVITTWKEGAMDGRDFNRLSQFIEEKDLHKIDYVLKDEYKGKHEHIPFTRENILKQLEKDVDFGFEKSLDQRGLSSAAMYQVVRMWNWILEEGLENFDSYAMYGLPLLKETAIKYGFKNPIGEDTGKENKYNCQY
jgi:hypothetical protein